MTQSATPHPPWSLGIFKRPASGNPVLVPNKASSFQCPMRKTRVNWEALHTFNPAAVVRDGKIYVLYRAEDDTGAMQIGGHTSRLGLAESSDGIHFTRLPEPVFFPGEDSQKDREWFGGCEDPRIVEAEDGTYMLTYTQWNQKVFSVGIATSKDLRVWTKHGTAYERALNGKYAKLMYKSAGVVGAVKNGRLIAAKIGGKYWMYQGEGHLYLAHSTDLINWTPGEDKSGERLKLHSPRPGVFDSHLAEVGPPPVLTKDGIVMFFNGKNDEKTGDKTLGPGAYACGWALFDKNEPAKLLEVLREPAFRPEMEFEKTGQYVQGTTFAEGLVFFKNQWFMYYGTADSFVGVAVAEAKKD